MAHSVLLLPLLGLTIRCEVSINQLKLNWHA